MDTGIRFICEKVLSLFHDLYQALMQRKLFLLKPSFPDEKLDAKGQLYYCPHCAMIEGILHYYPEIRNQLEVIYLDFPRPRIPLAALVGTENQGCPNLVIKKGAFHKTAPDTFTEYGEYYFSNNKYNIASYLAEEFGIPRFHP